MTQFITVDEALKLDDHMFFDSNCFAVDLAMALIKENNITTVEDLLFFTGSIFHAGTIAGVRSERERRKQKT